MAAQDKGCAMCMTATYFKTKGVTSRLFLLELVCVHITIAEIDSTILDATCIDHAITIKPV